MIKQWIIIITIPRIVSCVILFQISSQVIQTKHQSDSKIQRAYSIVQMSTHQNKWHHRGRMTSSSNSWMVEQESQAWKEKAKQNRISKKISCDAWLPRRDVFSKNVKCGIKKKWSKISNTKDRVWPHFQTPRRELKIQWGVDDFWWTSRCLEMWSNAVLIVWYIFSIDTKTKEKNGEIKSKKSKLKVTIYRYSV